MSTTHAPNLRSIDGDLDAMRNRSFAEKFPFPNLERIGGNMILAYTGMASFPKSIKHVGGNVVISDTEPALFMADCKAAKRSGIIQGEVMCIITP